MKHPYMLHTWNSLDEMQGFDRKPAGVERQSVMETSRTVLNAIRSSVHMPVRFVECAAA